MSDLNEKLLLKIEEAGRLASIGRAKSYELVASGAWSVVRIGRAVRVPRAALLAWIERNTGNSPESPET